MEFQRTDEWFANRCGRITASRMCDVLAFTKDAGVPYKSGKNKGKPRPLLPLKARTDYINELAAERLTGYSKAPIKAGPLDWGKEWEPVAREAYEQQTGVLVEEVGFLVHPLYDFIGASADFRIRPNGGGETKCPYDQEVHLRTLNEGLPPEHIEQIQGNIWVADCEWWDFVSFHPAFPPHLQLYVQRVPRDDAYISKLADACLSLNAEVQTIVNRHMEKQQCAA